MRWLGAKAEELGVEIYPGFAASEVQEILTILRSIVSGNCLNLPGIFCSSWIGIYEAQVSEYGVKAGFIRE